MLTGAAQKEEHRKNPAPALLIELPSQERDSPEATMLFGSCTTGLQQPHNSSLGQGLQGILKGLSLVVTSEGQAEIHQRAWGL